MGMGCRTQELKIRKRNGEAQVVSNVTLTVSYWQLTTAMSYRCGKNTLYDREVIAVYDAASNC